MTRKIFGTDGVRGKANVPPMTPDLVMRLAIAAGHYFTRGDHRHMVVIGKDTRLSGYMLEPALTAGFVARGMDVMLVGPLPTPAISMLTRSLRADLGVVISASHNPYEDNGLKFFGPEGHKLSDEVERNIESLVLSDAPLSLAAPNHLGRARRLDDAPGRYIEFVKNTFPKTIRLDGLKIVIDCANGAAYKVAPPVFWELGAEIIPIGISPNGCNINQDCGATAPEAMRQAVISEGADLGISLDGDADRVVMADEKGNIIDGDQIMALIAKSWKEADRLRENAVISTIMSNLGFERYLTSLGVSLVRTPVGDRYVSAAMRQHRCNVGGEQSGHIILSDYTTTGDGLIAALQVLAVIVKSGKPASQVCRVFNPTPQLLRNIRIPSDAVLQDASLTEALHSFEQEISLRGRLLIRRSGTEPLLRIMVEGDDVVYLESCMSAIIETIESASARIQASV